MTGWLYKRFLSLLMVMGMGIVLVGSVMINSVVAVLLAGRANSCPSPIS